MLETLFGNKNIQNILLFLLVNRKCYGQELHRALKTPLTPLQQALHRLERGEWIISRYEGKTRLYEFNTSHPLLEELESLLRKHFSLLPLHKKTAFHALRTVAPPHHALEVLLTCWEKLLRARTFSCHARSQRRLENPWQGNGDVIVSQENPSTLLFTEKGCWHTHPNGKTNFSNVFRWTLDRNAQTLSLEHLRRGPQHPVFLFHLIPSGKKTLTSIDSHLCGEDAYFGDIQFDKHYLRLQWRVLGPQKNEELICSYSPCP